jgi:hypothetical protein
MLFSMLQFDREPGRRALIVITDGFDSHSRADPARAIELGRAAGSAGLRDRDACATRAGRGAPRGASAPPDAAAGHSQRGQQRA